MRKKPPGSRETGDVRAKKPSFGHVVGAGRQQHERHGHAPTILEISGTNPAVKAEYDLLAMLYRRHVEFAVGHGIGVQVDGSPDPNHAVRVRTKVVPS